MFLRHDFNTNKFTIHTFKKQKQKNMTLNKYLDLDRYSIAAIIHTTPNASNVESVTKKSQI